MYKTNNNILTFTSLSPLSQASPGHNSLLIWFFTQLCGLFTWEMLPGPGSACYWTSMSWLSWPLHTSLTQSDKTSSITYSYWYYAFSLTSQLLWYALYYETYFYIFYTKNPTKDLENHIFMGFVCVVFSSLDVHNSPPYWSQSLEHFLGYLPVRHLNITLDPDVYIYTISLFFFVQLE